jgi:hypothetical protein
MIRTTASAAPVGVDDDQEPPASAGSQEDESVLGRRMVRIIEKEGGLVREGSLCLAEPNIVFAEVERCLPRSPLEPELCHAKEYMYGVCTASSS